MTTLVSCLRALLVLLSFVLAAPALAQTTVTLQQGLNGYSGSVDNMIAMWAPTTNHGEQVSYEIKAENNSSVLVRFAIFQSEGGPVPNGATITSATLSLYQYVGHDAVFKASRLKKAWTEAQSTWNVTGTGGSWETVGARGASDMEATPDGQGSVVEWTANNCSTPAAPAICWLNMDVTSGVQAFAAGTANHGWKVSFVSGSNPAAGHEFNSTENTSWPALRPKLAVTYTMPSGSSVTLQQGLNGYTGSVDNMIAMWAATTNHGEQPTYEIKAENNSSTLVRFAIFQSEGGPVPNGANILSATLSLYQYVGHDAIFKASRLKRSWTEGQSTWNVTGTGSSWETVGARGASDIEATPDGQGPVVEWTANNCSTPAAPAVCWLNMNVTSGVQAFASGVPNHGWKVSFVSGSNPAAGHEFNSTENTNWPALRPKLTVVYDDGCAKPTPILSATPSSGAQAPLNVTFDATGTISGSMPITGLRLEFGDGTSDVNWSTASQQQLHSYTASGQYEAKLWATNACGTSATPASRTITVGGQVPSPSFTWSQAPGTLNVTFNAAGSSDGSSAITSLRLRFGHGSPEQEVTWSNKNTPQIHAYPAPGTYTARLTATNAHGTSAEFSQPITVADPGQPQPEIPTNGETVPTFNSMSLYMDLDSAPPGNKVFVRFRKDTPGAPWRDGLPLWYDGRTTNPGCNGNCALPYTKSNGQKQRVRGSVVNLDPGSTYVFELGTETSPGTVTWQWQLVGTTWPQTAAKAWPDTQMQDGPTIPIPTNHPEGQSYDITVGGSPETGYKVYDGQNLAVIRGNKTSGPTQGEANSGAININADYVVVRRVKVDGAYGHAIHIGAGRKNVVIEDSELTDFSYVIGRTRANFTNGQHKGGNGIDANNNNSKIVIQRNRIHTPQYGANPWDWDNPAGENHPLGPAGIHFRSAGRQNVIRYNEIYSNAGPTSVNGSPSVHRKWFIDGIGGEDNMSANGSPGADSDVHGNIVMHVMDDGIEAEGGGRNVRIWGNYVSHADIGIASTVAHFGPLYTWRNVVNRLRHRHLTNPDSDTTLSKGFKAFGVNGGWGGGRKYFFHNTFLQTPGSEFSPSQTYPLGAGQAIAGASTFDQGMRETITLNNIFHVRRDQFESIRVGAGGSANEFNYDLYNGVIKPDGTTGIFEPQGYRFTTGTNDPVYKPGHGWQSIPALAKDNAGPGIGNYQLDPNSPVGQDGSPAGRRCGEPIPNFNDASSHQPASGLPDCGAHEHDAPAMKFGITAGQ